MAKEDFMLCLKKAELVAAVQLQLETIAQLALAEADAIKDKTESTWLDIDQKIELAIGEKERAIGALREHRKEHGC
jgi:hypothetical protein